MFEKILKKIQEAVRTGRYEVTIPHFLEELQDDDLSMIDAESTVLTGSIVNRFTRDPRGVQYKIHGRATDGRPTTVVARFKETGIPLFITIYVDPGEE